MSIVRLVDDVATYDDVSPLTAQQRFTRTFLQHRLSVISAAYLLLLPMVALFGEYFLVHDPIEVDLAHVLEGPSAEHLLGTDHLGRSTLSRLVVATGVALKAAALAVGIAIVLGAPLGLLSGYFGGWWDRTAMRIVEAIIALPGLLVAIAILAILGPSLTNAMIALGLAISTAFFRLMRGAAIEVKEELYIDAARVSGASTLRIVFRHVLPNVTGPLTVQTTLAFSQVLLAEAGLSFIGLGVQPPEASWGVMLSVAQNYIYQHPFMAVPPGIMIMLTVLAFNLFGDGLRDALARVDTSPPAPVRKTKTGRTSSTPNEGNRTSVLSIENLHVQFRQPAGEDLEVVTDVSFSVPAGRTVGLVGESGCGKSVTAMAIMGLLPDNGHASDGVIYFAGRELTSLSETALNQIRGEEIGMIFQGPMSSLNPAFTVKNQIAETICRHKGITWRDAEKRAIALLERVGIPDANARANDYPHQFSGGMAQRVMIAIALSCEPRLLIADEPTTALDVTIQGQVLDLLTSLQQERGMSILLITHDLGVVADMCDEAVVMYAGQVVEQGPVNDVLLEARHPYTAGLLASMPRNEVRSGKLPQIPGRVPPAWAWPAGCRFHPRCPHATERCKLPIDLQQPDPHHQVRCILAGKPPGGNH
ncbi:MAG: dipeptide/oligopeptide/nickel ABC transporter permease/ATP-binding protein [Proteobacteria bacterium]|jgi:peptide/nickel transport system permease protein|nr:dipeptide/oligopeptide/nickel ABC transporter permease/ATP-binding protein [Pseudomonadota bacterium]MDA1298560.1 dipeptide/oligopeptide/nickel ABC transporter permease/ATP-binding protein [Pseudomonadota bacterium]